MASVVVFTKLLKSVGTTPEGTDPDEDGVESVPGEEKGLNVVGVGALKGFASGWGEAGAAVGAVGLLVQLDPAVSLAGTAGSGGTAGAGIGAGGGAVKG